MSEWYDGDGPKAPGNTRVAASKRAGQPPISRPAWTPPASGARPSLDVQPVRADVHERLAEGRQCAGSACHTSRDPLDMAVALADCDGCPVMRECEQVVQPRYCWFDGVCGGRAWLDGRPVQVRALTLDVPASPIPDLFTPDKECPTP